MPATRDEPRETHSDGCEAQEECAEKAPRWADELAPHTHGRSRDRLLVTRDDDTQEDEREPCECRCGTQSREHDVCFPNHLRKVRRPPDGDSRRGY